MEFWNDGGGDSIITHQISTFQQVGHDSTAMFVQHIKYSICSAFYTPPFEGLTCLRYIYIRTV